MDATEAKELSEKIEEAYRMVGLYELTVEGLGRRLKVKVMQDHTGGYTGLANLEVRGEGCGSFYRSLSPCETEDAAVADAIGGFFNFYSESAEVREVEDW